MKRERDGLRKRCACSPRRWDTCGHHWHYRVKVNGTRHRINLQKHFKAFGVLTRDEAEGLADRFRVQVRAGQSGGDVRLTLQDLADRFTAIYPDRYYVAILCATTGTNGVALGRRPLADITAADIEHAADACQQRASKGTNKGRDARRHLLTTARRLFNWGIRNKLARSTPFKEHGVSMITVPTSRQRDRRLVGDEEQRLRDAADPYTRDLLVAALETGCRGGELRSLQWRDVQDEFLVLQADKTKTKRRRIIPISSTLRSVLDRRRKGPDGQDLPLTAHVFGNDVGEEIPKRLANRWWSATCKRARVEGLHFHDLRHEFGSQLLEAGGQLHEVQAALGHSNIKMTSVYLNATQHGVKQAFEKLEARRRRDAMHLVG